MFKELRQISTFKTAFIQTSVADSIAKGHLRYIKKDECWSNEASFSQIAAIVLEVWIFVCYYLFSVLEISASLIVFPLTVHVSWKVRQSFFGEDFIVSNVDLG